jgi:hypothetical protein
MGGGGAMEVVSRPSWIKAIGGLKEEEEEEEGATTSSPQDFLHSLIKEEEGAPAVAPLPARGGRS